MSDEPQSLTDETFETYGTVQLIDWISTPAGQVRGLRGAIKVVSDESHVGFRARGANSANWLAVISGETQTWHVFGCQIRAVVEHRDDLPTMPDCYLVR